MSAGCCNGKRRVPRFFYGETRTEVADQLRVAIQAQRDGVLTAPTRMTLDQFLASLGSTSPAWTEWEACSSGSAW